MVPVPLCLVLAGAVFAVIRSPQSFRGPDGTRYPSTAFALWSDADWTAALPSITRLPLVDVNPATELENGTINAPSEWTVEPARVVATYTITEKTPAELAPLYARLGQQGVDALHERRADALAAEGDTVGAILERLKKEPTS